jgi:hypothetical protein
MPVAPCLAGIEYKLLEEVVKLNGDFNPAQFSLICDPSRDFKAQLKSSR